MGRVRGTVAGLVLAGVLVAAGCGDDDTDDAAGSGGSADGGFCDRAADIYVELTGTATLDEERVASLIDVMGDLEPPEAVADDWQATVDGLTTLSEGDIEAPDMDDPAVAAAMERAVGAFDAVASYLSEECGVDLTR